MVKYLSYSINWLYLNMFNSWPWNMQIDVYLRFLHYMLKYTKFWENFQNEISQLTDKLESKLKLFWKALRSNNSIKLKCIKSKWFQKKNSHPCYFHNFAFWAHCVSLLRVEYLASVSILGSKGDKVLWELLIFSARSVIWGV